VPILMADASEPPEQVPPGVQAVAGYIGGRTPHVWTRAEWRRFDGLKKHPYYVGAGRPNNSRDGESDAVEALAALFTLRAPKGIPVSLDMETDVSPAYCSGFGGLLQWAGFYPWVYGSADTVFRNPSLSGYHVADYLASGAPFMYGHNRVRATQYAADVNGWDLSEVKPWQFHMRMKAW
jgi:hypothetical protein